MMTALAPAASAGPAAFTGVSGTDGTPYGVHCVTGNPTVNCNAYDGKQYVWLNAGPATQTFGDGDYFFAVIAPGGQSNPNDGAPKLLSTDAYTDRSFSISGTSFTYTGTHDFVADPDDPNAPGGLKLRIGLLSDPDLGYLDTPNGGGVYILAICRLVDGAQPDNKDCKFDAFKAPTGGGGGSGTFAPPTATKTATGFHGHNVAWTIDKSADQADGSTIHSGTPVNVNYTVTATKTVTNEHWAVTGTISVFNSNDTPMTLESVTDQFAADYPELNATCVVAPSGGGSYTFPTVIPAATAGGDGESDFDYSCTFSGVANTPAYDPTDYDNRVSLTYDEPGNVNNPLSVDDAADALFTFPEAATLDAGSDPESVVVSDDNPGTLAALGGSGTTISATTVYNYSISLFNNLCVDHTNTAQIATTDETQPDGWPRTDSWTITFCGPNAGGLTQGWWQNKNGQSLLKNNVGSACTTLNGYVSGHTASTDLINVDGTATKQYATGDCATSGTFSYLPSFDLYVFNLANSSGTGWSMLLSQWLTTTLDTASFPNVGKAGGPGLSSGAKIYNPDGLLGLPTCTTIGALLNGAVTQFSSYKNSKSTVTALSSLFDKINNNLAPSC